MGFGEAVSTAFRNYATFSGRARRSEFWFFYLFLAVTHALLGILVAVALATSPTSTSTVDGKVVESISPSAFAIAMYVVIGLWSLATILPFLAIQVRRLHDIDRTGWWWWIGLVCCVGPIILLVFYVTEGVRGPNRYGPDPRAS